MENNNKSKKRIVILIIFLLLIILGLVGYIMYDKDVFSVKNENELKENKDESIEEENSSADNNKKEEDLNNVEQIKELDLTKCLNNKGFSYSNATDVGGNYGLSMIVNDDKRSITLAIDWNVFGPISTASTWAPEVVNYQIKGFSKDINSTFIGETGQDSKGLVLYYLMDDGTVEYTPLFILNTDSYGNKYYTLNYSYEYSNDGKIIGQFFATKGSINNIKNVVKLYNIDVSNGASWRSTIGATKDGSFYDLGSLING